MYCTSDGQVRKMCILEVLSAGQSAMTACPIGVQLDHNIAANIVFTSMLFFHISTFKTQNRDTPREGLNLVAMFPCVEDHLALSEALENND